ncbi:hypothetical protein [Micromonospora sp. NPDC049679]|uniref:hypothetical protein n=1 Tax=Micromonospora sp. NPDC049679 TaxID=3155920 RepID=UPI0034071E96
MQTREERTLKLIKGAKPGTPGRNVRRRAFTRHVPPPEEPVEALLKKLDSEPVDGPADDPTASSGTAPVTERDAPAVPRGRRVLIALLVAALAAGLAATGVFGHRWYADRSLDAAHQAALAAAKQTTVNFVSVSASSVDRDLQRISAGATGEFREQFTRGGPQVRAAVVENKVESRGSVLRAGLVSGDRRSAVVLVAIDATVKNVNAPDGRASHYRIQVDMARDGRSGKWLVSRLQFVG